LAEIDKPGTIIFKLHPLPPIGSPPTMSQAVVWVYKQESLSIELFHFTLMIVDGVGLRMFGFYNSSDPVVCPRRFYREMDRLDDLFCYQRLKGDGVI
jgi:hypothetical protein